VVYANQCVEPEIEGGLEGSIQVDYLPRPADARGEWVGGRISILGLRTRIQNVRAEVNGIVEFTWERTEEKLTLNVRVTESANYRTSYSAAFGTSDRVFNERVLSLDAAKALDARTALGSVRMALEIASDVLGGRYSLRTAQPMVRPLNSWPIRGQWYIEGALGTRVLLEPPANRVQPGVPSVRLVSAQGSRTLPSTNGWRHFVSNYVWWWGGLRVDGARFLAGGGMDVQHPDRDADRLAQNTEAPARWVMEQGVYRRAVVYLNAPVAPGQRFDLRMEPVQDIRAEERAAQPVALRVLIDEAKMSFEPATPLEFGVEYRLLGTINGTDIRIYSDIRLNAALPGMVSANGLDALPVVLETPKTVVAVARPLSAPVVAANRSLEVSAVDSNSGLGRIVAFSWRQVSGPALRLDGASQPIVKVSLASAPPAQPTPVILELSVTDSEGNTSRALRSLMVVDDPARTRFIWVDGPPGRDSIAVGGFALSSREPSPFSAQFNESTDSQRVAFSSFQGSFAEQTASVEFESRQGAFSSLRANGGGQWFVGGAGPEVSARVFMSRGDLWTDCVGTLRVPRISLPPSWPEITELALDADLTCTSRENPLVRHRFIVTTRMLSGASF
jgi:hypothetical protein